MNVWWWVCRNWGCPGDQHQTPGACRHCRRPLYLIERSEQL